MTTPKARSPTRNRCRSVPGEKRASSDGSSCTLSCHPANLPSRSTTSAVIRSSSPTRRSVPRTTATSAFPAAAATVAHARSRRAGSWGGTTFPVARYPGTKHSGKQISPARSTAACAMASVASVTASASEAG
jgi:hypothetical protein